MESEKKIIFGFAGRKRSGKGLLANFMVDKYGATKITIASYLKKFCAGLLGMSIDEMNEKKDDGTILDIPFQDEWCERIAEATEIELDKIKEICDGVVIKDVRHLLQFVGTDVIRKFVPDWHINQALKDIEQTDNEVFAVDDVRFPNELAGIRQMGGIGFFIIRPAQTDVSNHFSETALTPISVATRAILVNDTSTPECFVGQFSEVAEYCVDWIRTHDNAPDPNPTLIDDITVWDEYGFGWEEGPFSADVERRLLKASRHYSHNVMNALLAPILFSKNEDPLISDIALQMKTNWKAGVLWYDYPQNEEEQIKSDDFRIEEMGLCFKLNGLGKNRCVITHPLYIEFLKYYMK